jgi:hypothetical protein
MLEESRAPIDTSPADVQPLPDTVTEHGAPVCWHVSDEVTSSDGKITSCDANVPDGTLVNGTTAERYAYGGVLN